MMILASSIDGPLYVKIGTYDDPKLRDFTAPDLKAASQIVVAYLDENDISSSDWRGGEVVSEDTGLCVAVISPNGRTWFHAGTRNPEGDALPGELEFDLDA